MSTNTIPLNIIHLQDGYHLLVEVEIFKSKYFAVLDTGASRSVFDFSFLKINSELPLDRQEIQAATLFSPTETYQLTIPKFKIGKCLFKNYQAVSIDLSSVTQTYSQFGHPPIVAIIGGDILMQTSAKIDYKKKVLRLYR